MVMVHVLLEYGRHNGHAVFLREGVDGTVGARVRRNHRQQDDGVGDAGCGPVTRTTARTHGLLRATPAG